MSQLRAFLLGAPRIEYEGQAVELAHRKTLALLAYLVLNPGTHRREHLASLLWPESDPQRASAYLRNALWQLNQTPLSDWLTADRETIHLQQDEAFWVDVDQVGKHLAMCQSHNHTESDVCAECIPILSDIADLYKGSFMEGFTLEDSTAFDDWQFFQADSLNHQLDSVLDRLLQWYTLQAEYERGITVARRWLALDPLNEAAHQNLMRLYALGGKHSAALRQYQDCVRVLEEELGVPPSVETTGVYEAIRSRKLGPPSAGQTESKILLDTVQDRPSPSESASQFPSPDSAQEKQFVSETDLQTPAQLQGERRTITALVVSIEHFPVQNEKADLEIWAETMHIILSDLEGEVLRYGGEINQYRDDGLLFIFGLPVAHEDDAERAVLAAMAMQASIKHYDGNFAGEIIMRAGIFTGEVIATTIGMHQHSAAMGQVVKLARQLTAVAEPNSVLVAEPTYRLITPRFQWSIFGRYQVEGVHAPLALYNPLAHVDPPNKGRGIEGLQSPLVGRDVEFLTLKNAVERLKSGLGGIITVVGEAGIGKSRLVAELKSLIHSDSSEGDIDWLEGRCLSYASNTIYYVWIDILRSWLGTTPEDAPAAVREVLWTLVQETCPDRLMDVYPFLVRLLTLPLDEMTSERLQGVEAEGLKVLTFRALEALITGLSLQNPLVLVFEDLHWADPTSLELLQRTLALTDRLPLLLVCVMRPVTEHGCWQIKELANRDYRHRHTDLSLQPLSDTESGILVGHLLHIDDLPEELRNRILERAEGNPFFLEEILRSLIEDEVIACEEIKEPSTGLMTRHWYLTGDVAELAIPLTLHGVLTMRIDRLPLESKRLLQFAAVIGRLFSLNLLDQIYQDKGKVDLEDHLAVLQRTEFIKESVRLPERQYIFKHVLTQEVAYQSLLRRDQRAIHQKIALKLEQLYPEYEDQLGLLAYHWEQAGDVERAFFYLHRVAEQSAAQYANAEAIAYVTRALALVPDDTKLTDKEQMLKRFNLLMVREGVYNVLGDREAQHRDMQELKKLANQLNDNSTEGIHRVTDVTLRESEYADFTGDYLLSCELAQKVIDMAHQTGDVPYEAKGYLRLASVFMDDYTLLEKAVDLTRKTGDQVLVASSLRMLGLFTHNVWDQEVAQPILEEALTMWRDLGNRLEEGKVLNDLSQVALTKGDYNVATQRALQSLLLCQDTGNLRDEGWVYITLNYIYTDLGEHMQRMSFCRKALETFQRTNDW